jgi:hypothetical protein
MIAEQVTVANGAPAIFQPMLDYIKSLAAPPGPHDARMQFRFGQLRPKRTIPAGAAAPPA